MKATPAYWYDVKRSVPVGAKLLSKIYGYVSKARKNYFTSHPEAVYQVPVPVVVIGNITVGGTGKTPLAIALINDLKQKGYQPALISRGYGGKAGKYPQRVYPESDPRHVGDEPVLIAGKTGVPVVVDPQRKRGIQYLLEEINNIDVIVSDDGLQHYAMGRDIEILVIDGNRRFGNGMLLPAGPLRESIDRKRSVDFCICNGIVAENDEFQMLLKLENVAALRGGEQKTLREFADKKVHAIAGIGNPQRFFSALTQQGMEVISHAFADHHQFKENDCRFSDDYPVLMTEKDAVKCQQFNLTNAWVVPAEPILPQEFYTQFYQKLQSIDKG